MTADDAVQLPTHQPMSLHILAQVNAFTSCASHRRDRLPLLLCKRRRRHPAPPPSCGLQSVARSLNSEERGSLTAYHTPCKNLVCSSFLGWLDRTSGPALRTAHEGTTGVKLPACWHGCLGQRSCTSLS